MENTLVEVEGGHNWSAWTRVEDVHSSLVATSRFGRGKQPIFKSPPPRIKPPEELAEWERTQQFVNDIPVYSRKCNDQAVRSQLRNIGSKYYTNEAIEQHYYNNGWLSGSSSGNSCSLSRSRIGDDSESSSGPEPADDDMIGFVSCKTHRSQGKPSSSSSRIGVDLNETTPERLDSPINEESSKPSSISTDSVLSEKPASEPEKEVCEPLRPVTKKSRPKMRNALLSSLLRQGKTTSSTSEVGTFKIDLKTPSDFMKPLEPSLKCAAGFENSYNYMDDATIDDATRALIAKLEKSPPSPPTVNHSELNVNAKPYVPTITPQFHLDNNDFPPLS